VEKTRSKCSGLVEEITKKGTEYIKSWDLSEASPSPQLVVKCKKENGFELVINRDSF
jgi:hypothetical protein